MDLQVSRVIPLDRVLIESELILWAELNHRTIKSLDPRPLGLQRIRHVNDTQDSIELVSLSVNWGVDCCVLHRYEAKKKKRGCLPCDSFVQDEDELKGDSSLSEPIGIFVAIVTSADSVFVVLRWESPAHAMSWISAAGLEVHS